MSETAVRLDDDQWAHVLDTLEDRNADDVCDCRDAIAEQVRGDQDDHGEGDQRGVDAADRQAFDASVQQSAVDADTAFELLSDPVRRELLWTCRGRGEVAVDDLVDSVAGELDDDPERLGVDLHHRHLPKLASADVVSVDSDTVHYGGDELLDCLVAVDRE